MATTTEKINKDKTERTYPQISTLPASLLPTTPSNHQDTSRRIIIIGDVHGHLKALEALLHKAEFSTSRGDTVVFAGDLVNKGPDSAGVIALAMRIGAFGVRGNHEDRVLRAWKYYESKHTKRREHGEDGRTSSNRMKPHHADLVTAKSLKPEHRAWLSGLPLILRIGDLGPRYGEVLTVHAGLVPGIPLESQDPEAVMNMRTLLQPSKAHASDDREEPPIADQTSESQYDQTAYEPDYTDQRVKKREPMVPSPYRHGAPWAKVWTSYQTSRISSRPHTPPTTVVYGHDAKAGLQMRRYTFGLDSGCARDKTLTGVIFEYAANSHGEHDLEGQGIEAGEDDWDISATTGESLESQSWPKIRHRLVSVSCA
ncbi:Metallo-dependent phosphatase-like protein [Xylaria digitata]|nr:Metallo-dependent phosphatase-like protein [Xylaria digitata]